MSEGHLNCYPMNLPKELAIDNSVLVILIAWASGSWGKAPKNNHVGREQVRGPVGLHG